MDRRIGILFLCDEIEAATGGSEQNILMLLDNLPPDKYRFFLAVLRQNHALPHHFSRVKTHILNLSTFYNFINTFKAMMRLRNIIKDNNISILQAYFPDSQLLSSISFPEYLGCKLVIARRSLGYHNSSILFFRNRLIGHLASYYLVNSLSIRKELIEKEKVAENKIKIIYNPINPQRVKSGLSNMVGKESLSIGSNSPTIGIVANIRPVKDYGTFFKAARLVKYKFPNAKFVIVGAVDHAYWESIKHMVDDFALRNDCILLNNVDNPCAIIPIFDVAVLTSISEGLSNALIEYAAAGVASVATETGGNGEVIIDSVTGFLVPVGSFELIADKIVELLGNKTKRLEMGANAQKHVNEKFNVDSIVKQYDLFYNQILLKP